MFELDHANLRSFYLFLTSYELPILTKLAISYYLSIVHPINMQQGNVEGIATDTIHCLLVGFTVLKRKKCKFCDDR